MKGELLNLLYSGAALLLLGFLALLLARSLAPAWLLRRLGAYKSFDPVAKKISLQLESIARARRMPLPELYFLPEFSPHVLVMRKWGKVSYLLVCESLPMALEEKEMEIVLGLALSKMQNREARWGAAFALLASPLAWLVKPLPKALWFVLSPWIVFVLRLVFPRKQVLRSDAKAFGAQHAWRIAATLKKLAILSTKLPPKSWNLLYDPLYLLSPLAVEAQSLPLSSWQPSLPERLGALQNAKY